MTSERFRRFDPFGLPVSGWNASDAVVNGDSVVVVGSNDYLGLTREPRVQAAAIDAIGKYGVGCTGSRMLTGTTQLHQDLERRLADFLGAEAALVFASGFGTNLGSLSALASRQNDTIVYDAESHTSIREAARIGGASVRSFRHNDVSNLAMQLERNPANGIEVLVTEGVFSLSGDRSPLAEMTAFAASRRNALVFLDDAHGFGLLGEGRGSAREAGVAVDVYMTSFSKALATTGGAVAGPADLIEYLRWHAGAYTFSAALPPSCCAAAMSALDIVIEDHERRERFWKLTNLARDGFAAAGFDVGMVKSPVIALRIGTEHLCLDIAYELFSVGVWVSPIIVPAVSRGQALLRISFMASQSEAQIERVVSAVVASCRRRGIPARA